MDLLRQLRKELKDIVDVEIERELRKILFNAVSIAKDATVRVDTGFLKNSWYFDYTIPEKEEKNEKVIPNKASQAMANISRFKLGDVGFIINNADYASHHDLGTMYITPLFMSHQVEFFIDREVAKIK